MVLAGGAIGSSLRFLTTNIFKYYYPLLPVGTFVVNILGSFLIGIIMCYLQNKSVPANFVKYFLIIGLLGSFTTFSAFSFEAIDLLNNKKFFISFFYILLSVGCCLFFCLLGYNINKILF